MTIYNNISIGELGLIGWWKLNGNANDSSGNGNDGTINGVPATLGWWKLDGNANDSSGNGYNGTWSGTEDYTTGVQFTQAGLFDGGTSTDIEITASSFLTTFTSFSISVWINATEFNGNDVPFSCWGSNKGFGIYQDNNWYFGRTGNWATVDANVTTDGWHLHTAVWDGSNIYSYKDGILIDSTAAATVDFDSITNDILKIGGDNRNTSRQFTGSIADLRIYGDIALSLIDIEKIYNEGNGLTTDLTLFYPEGKQFDESAGYGGYDDEKISVDGAITGLFEAQRFTFSAWIKLRNPDFSGQTRRIIMSKTNRLELSVDTSFRVKFSVSDGSFTNVLSTTTLVEDEWYHLLATFDGSDMKLYINNVLENSASKSAFANPSNDIWIGNWSSNQTFFGQVQDVRIYTRAISECEIAKLYNQGNATITKFLGQNYEDDALNVSVKGSMSDNNSSGSFTIQLPNDIGEHKDDYSIGQDVVITAEQDQPVPTEVVLAGTIEDISFSGKGTEGYIVLSGRDYTSLLQDVTIKPVVYNNQDIADIMIDIITNNVPGVGTTNITATNVIIDNISFDHEPVFDGFKSLLRGKGLFFYIDEDKELQLLERSSVSSGVTLDNTNVIRSAFTKKGKDIVNQVWVYGSRQQTGRRETFTADGGSVFQLEKRPQNTRIVVGGSTVPKVGGVFRQEVATPGSPTQYVVDLDAKQAIFISGTSAGDNIPVSGTDVVTVDYDVSTLIAKFANDDVSIAQYGGVPKERIIRDNTIIDPRQATNIAVDTLLEESSEVVQGSADVEGLLILTPGKTTTVTLPDYNISEQDYDVLETKYTFNKKNNLKDQVLTVKLNKRVIKITDTIKSLALDIRALQADDSVDREITNIKYFTGSVGLRAEYYLKTRAINDSFVLGHPINGILGYVGSPTIGSLVGSVTWDSGIMGFGYDKCIVGAGSAIGSPGYLPERGYAAFRDGGSHVISSGQNISMWTNITSYTSGHTGGAEHKNKIAPLTGFSSDSFDNEQSFLQNGSQFRFQREDGTIVTIGLNTVVQTSSWYHLSVNYNENNTEVYLNGAFAGSSAGRIGDNRIVYNRLLFGYANLILDGKIDDFRHYSRPLSTAEIGSLSNKINYPLDSMMNYFKFDEGIGSVFTTSTSGTAYKLQPLLGDRRSSAVTFQSGGNFT